MKQQSLVEVRSLSKKFCRDLKKSLRYGIRDIGREILGRPQNAERLRSDEFWALRDVSFSLFSGEALGLLGRNGAGKTTLLRLLNGLIRPDTGLIGIHGRLTPLIELGAGFAPILTGRENIYVNGAILGLPGKIVDDRIDAIIDFAEIGDFIDTPVQSYSEGMKARLGFAVAVHLVPDLMLVDEVLAVGDLGFQRKCLKHMARYLSNDEALILVSHNMHLIQSICERCLVLDAGRIVFDGTTPGAVEKYSTLNNHATSGSYDANVTNLNESNPVIIDRVDIHPIKAADIRPGGAIQVTLHFKSLEEFVPVTWGFSLWTADQQIRIATNVAKYDGKLHRLCGGAGTLSCVIKDLPLIPSKYFLKSGIYEVETGWPIARHGWEQAAACFEIKGEETEANSRHRIDHDIVNLSVEWID